MRPRLVHFCGSIWVALPRSELATRRRYEQLNLPSAVCGGVGLSRSGGNGGYAEIGSAVMATLLVALRKKTALAKGRAAGTPAAPSTA